MRTFNQHVSDFIKTHKTHTQAAVAITLLGCDHVLNTRDWTGLARLLSAVEPRMQARMRRIIGAVLGGVSLRADTEQPTGMRFSFGANFGPTDKMQALRDLVEAKVSIFSEAMDNFLGLEPAAKVAFDLGKRSAVLAAKAVAEGIEERIFLEAALTAYRAARKAADEAALAKAPVIAA